MPRVKSRVAPRRHAGWEPNCWAPAYWLTVVVGSGIAAASLSSDDVGLQLLENSTATVFGLAVLILILGPVSG